MAKAGRIIPVIILLLIAAFLLFSSVSDMIAGGFTMPFQASQSGARAFGNILPASLGAVALLFAIYLTYKWFFSEMRPDQG